MILKSAAARRIREQRGVQIADDPFEL